MEEADAATGKVEGGDAAAAPLTDTAQADDNAEAPVDTKEDRRAEEDRRVRCPSPSPASPAPTRVTNATASSSSSAASEELLDGMMDDHDLGSYDHEPATASPGGGTAAAVARALAARTAGFGRADEDLNKEEPRKKKEQQETKKGARRRVR